MTDNSITLRIRVRWQLLFAVLWSIGLSDQAFRLCVKVEKG